MHEATILRVFASPLDATLVYSEVQETTVIIEHGSRGPQGPQGLTGIGVSFQTFSAPGTISPKTGKSRFYCVADMEIVGIRVACGTSPIGSPIVVDINRNGNTMYSNQANRPYIAAGNYYALATLPDITELSAGDYITVDIDQVGSSSAGTDLTVMLQLNER